MREGVLRKISGGKLRGFAGVGWNVLDFYWSLEAFVWVFAFGVAAVKGTIHFLSWLS